MSTSSPPSLINRQVAEYYGKTLTSSKDLKTNACCTAKSPPNYIRDAIANIHDTVVSKYYGCGLCLPTYDLKGLVVLDLGCGAGRDVYIASQLVGPSGRVVGIDMTPELLAVARDTQAFHAEKFGFDNVQFYQGYLETMNEIKELEKGSFDLIISNCVINLCADKEAVLRHCRDLLKPSGELYFSDVYSNRRIPQALREDPVLWGECLSGALYWNDFENLARRVGFQDPRLVEDALITVNSDAVKLVMDDVGDKGLQFYSATYRLWNMPATLLEPQGEDYGQAVSYKGTVARHPSGCRLDKHHYFETGRIVPVSGNTYNMLKESLLKEHFEFFGTFDTHFGIFGGRRAAGGTPFGATIASGGKGGASCKMKGGCSAL
jgi:arsenite methyltransferase